MRAMVLEQTAPIETSPLRSMQVDDPWPQDGEIRLRVTHSAVCRTDLEIVEGQRAKKKLPLIPGHQMVGIVDKLGKNTRRFKVGDRVGCPWLRSTCGTCQYCAAGAENLCDGIRFNGYHQDGGYADFCLVPENFAHELPVELESKIIAPLLCAGSIGDRTLKKSGLVKGMTLGIFGFGGAAHLTMQFARARGARVFVISRGAGHRAFAEKMGADWVGDSPYSLPRKLDTAILFASSGEMIPSILSSLKKGGSLGVVGLDIQAVPALNFEKELSYEKTLYTVTACTRRDTVECLSEAVTAGVKPQIALYPLAEANQALLDLKAERVNGCAVLEM